MLHCRIVIVLFAGERIFKIGTLLAKLQAKWFDRFMYSHCERQRRLLGTACRPLHNGFTAAATALFVVLLDVNVDHT